MENVENLPVDTCYCIIAHPDKPKFLAVKHSEGWATPTLKIPAGLIDYQAQKINAALLQKYGLATRVLRPMVRIKGHQYVELELARQGACRPIKAVWVDQGEYLRTRAVSPLQPDPLEVWFADWRNPQRQLSPWQVTGWFAQAEAWILQQADRLGYAPTGPVEQFRSGWIRSCLLRLPTAQGWLYFKAGELVQPPEVALTESLAGAWPGYVQRPLAADLTRNWMLNPDYYHGAERIRDPGLLPRFAAAMGHIQAESAGSLQPWRALGCQEYALDTFRQFCEQPAQLLARLSEGVDPLSDSELNVVQSILAAKAGDIQRLADLGLPLTLVHHDFRSDNLVMTAHGPRIYDWADTLITHPFLVLYRVIGDYQVTRLGRFKSPGTMAVTESILDQVRESYFSAIAHLAAEDVLQIAWRLLVSLVDAYVLTRQMRLLGQDEHASSGYLTRLASLRLQAQLLIEMAQTPPHGRAS